MQITLDTNDSGDLDLIRKLAEVLTPNQKLSEDTPAAMKAQKAPAKKAASAPPAEEAPADSAGPTMKDAVTLASQRMSEDRTADVKKALTDLGVSRVSELSEDQLSDFIAALS